MCERGYVNIRNMCVDVMMKNKSRYVLLQRRIQNVHVPILRADEAIKGR